MQLKKSLLDSLKIEEIADKDNNNTSLFVFHHLPSDMGVTIGNFLRRIILSYLEGVAPVGVKITDKNGVAESKFKSLDGVKEVALYVIMNLKKIILEEKNLSEGISYLDLKIKNNSNDERLITAGDFGKNSEIEIKNPDLYLATLAPDCSLEIRMYYQKNWGYHQVEKQEKLFSDEDNIIVLDTDFSPIKGGKVSFQIKSPVIGLHEKEEELYLTITSDGAIKPKEALKKALELSQDFLTNITNLISVGSKKEKKISENK